MSPYFSDIEYRFCNPEIRWDSLWGLQFIMKKIEKSRILNSVEKQLEAINKVRPIRKNLNKDWFKTVKKLLTNKIKVLYLKV